MRAVADEERVEESREILLPQFAPSVGDSLEVSRGVGRLISLVMAPRLWPVAWCDQSQNKVRLSVTTLTHGGSHFGA